MKKLLFLIALLSLTAGHAATLAQCDSFGVHITIVPGKNDNQALATINGHDVKVKRLMEDGAVTYESSSFKLLILGNHREMGNPLGYLTQEQKKTVVVCREGQDIEKIADDTELY